MPKILKFLIGLGAVVFVGLVVAWVFGVQWFARWETARVAREKPFMSMTPKPLADTRVNNDTVSTIKNYHGYAIEFPWQGETGTKDYGKGGVTYQFSGRIVTLYSMAPNLMMDAMQKNPQNQRNIDNLFEGDTPKTDYELVRRVLNVTPESFSWSSDKIASIRNGTLYALKATTVPVEASSGIFIVNTPAFHGFQFGVPESKQTGVEVDLYNDQVTLKFTFREKGGAPPVIPQADINRVVQSVRYEPGLAPLINLNGGENEK